MKQTLWILAGDAALHNPALLRALDRLPLSVDVRIVPRGDAARFWRMPLPDVMMFGASSLRPSHPLVLRAGHTDSCTTVLVTYGMTSAALDHDVHVHLALPQSTQHILRMLFDATGTPRPAPARVALPPH